MTKAARLDMRLDAADDLLIRRAAEVSGTSVSAFVLTSARDRASHVLADRSIFTLTSEQADELDRRLRAEPRAKRRLSELAREPERFE
ncbi:MAG: DUF1778 domain-containing protein [Acidimicrobiales bacterium]|nr:DUF1778 domain-containing protein [Acidimicrobiales bacterium]